MAHELQPEMQTSRGNSREIIGYFHRYEVAPYLETGFNKPRDWAASRLNRREFMRQNNAYRCRAAPRPFK